MEKLKPAYQRIKQTILEHIHAGRWKAGEQIPTEHALTEQFGVSRMTVNRALNELAAEKVLDRRQGSGTFVAQQQFNHTFVEVRNIAHDIQATHHRYQAKVLQHTLLEFGDLPTELQQDFLLPQQQLDKTYPIVHVNILHMADDIPLQFEERWVKAALVPDFFAQDFSQVNTSDYLIRHVPLEDGEYTIYAKLANHRVATALSIQQGEPVLLLHRRTFSQGQVVTVVNMWHAGSRYQFFGQLSKNS